MAGPVQLHGVAVPQQHVVHHARGRSVRVLRAEAGYSTSPFIGAAVVEVLLSTDNICLFHQIFEHFRVPLRDQARPPVHRNSVHGAHPRSAVLRAQGHL